VSAQERAPRLQHDGIFYDDERTLASAAISFVREGIERDEVVMVNTGRNPVTSLLRAMFRSEDQVVFAEKPVYALDGYHRIMQRGLDAGVKGYRAMGFIDFDHSSLPWQEWVRYEAAVNRVFADFPFQTLCPYDTASVAGEITEAMVRAHSGLVGPDGRRENDRYLDPAELVVMDGLRTPVHPLQETTPRMVLKPGDDLTELRLEVYAATMFTELPSRKVDDLVSAVGEVVANAHKHGDEPVALNLWAADTTVVCTVTDTGPGIADPLAGYARSSDPSEGLGLWAARQLVDVLDYERDEAGFTVRVISHA
jgi:anti-sigma regulatory factor (Ser/Thr protein kinase)